MDSLTRSELKRMLREAEPDLEFMEEQRRIYDEAEREKQKIWAEYERLANRRVSRLERLMQAILGI